MFAAPTGSGAPGCSGRAAEPSRLPGGCFGLWPLLGSLPPVCSSPPLNSVLPTGAWRGRMAPSLPVGLGARQNFFLRAICASDALSLLLPSLGDSNPLCSTGRALNRGAATPEDSGGTRLFSAAGARLAHPALLRLLRAVPLHRGCGHRGDDLLPLLHLGVLCSAVFLRKRGNTDAHASDCPATRHRHCSGGFSLSSHPGASSTGLISLCYGNLRGRGIVFFHGKPLSHRDVLGNERPGSLPPPAVT